MSNLLDQLEHLAEEYATLLWVLGVGSALTAVLGIALVPRWLAGLHRDHFVHSPREEARAGGPRRVTLRILRNLIGTVLLIAGVAMLLLPGQGLLTLLVALGLLDFPGKRRLQLMVVSRPTMRRLLDRLRRHRGQPPFRLPRPQRRRRCRAAADAAAPRD